MCGVLEGQGFPQGPRRATLGTMSEETGGYYSRVPAAERVKHEEMADLCRLGRDAYFEASAAGFYAAEGTLARAFDDSTQDATWPGGPWPPNGPTASLHMVGLMLSNSAAGRVGELGALLDAGEVFWSLPGNARGVLELSARLFRIYSQPFLPFKGVAPPPTAVKSMYAAAHREIFEAAFSAQKLATLYRDLDTGDTARHDAVNRADAELARLVGAYGPLYDPVSTDMTRPRRLKLEGVGDVTMTDLIDSMTEWVWADPTKRPRPLYKAFSGHAHASLDADGQLYERVVENGQERFTRRIPTEFVDNSVVTALAMFQLAFARLTGFYGWNEDPLHRFSERLAALFPTTFTYT